MKILSLFSFMFRPKISPWVQSLSDAIRENPESFTYAPRFAPTPPSQEKEAGLVLESIEFGMVLDKDGKFEPKWRQIGTDIVELANHQPRIIMRPNTIEVETIYDSPSLNVREAELLVETCLWWIEQAETVPE